MRQLLRETVADSGQGRREEEEGSGESFAAARRLAQVAENQYRSGL